MGQLNKPVTEEISHIYLSTMPQVVCSPTSTESQWVHNTWELREQGQGKCATTVTESAGTLTPWDTTLFLPARTCLTYRKKARVFQAALMTKELYHILFHSYFPILANCLHWKYRERKRKIRQPTVPVLASPYLLIGKCKVQSFGRICVN